MSQRAVLSSDKETVAPAASGGQSHLSLPYDKITFRTSLQAEIAVFFFFFRPPIKKLILWHSFGGFVGTEWIITALEFSSSAFSLPLQFLSRCTRWRSRLRHCATSRKVAGSIPDDIIRNFYWHNPSCRTMALGSTQHLTEMSTRNISLGGKGSRCIGLTTLPPSCADCLEIWEPQPSGTLRACPGQ